MGLGAALAFSSWSWIGGKRSHSPSSDHSGQMAVEAAIGLSSAGCCRAWALWGSSTATKVPALCLHIQAHCVALCKSYSSRALCSFLYTLHFPEYLLFCLELIIISFVCRYVCMVFYTLIINSKLFAICQTLFFFCLVKLVISFTWPSWKIQFCSLLTHACWTHLPFWGPFSPSYGDSLCPSPV